VTPDNGRERPRIHYRSGPIGPGHGFGGVGFSVRVAPREPTYNKENSMRQAMMIAGILALGTATALADDVAEARKALDGAKVSFKDAMATAQQAVADGKATEIELDWEGGAPRYEVELLVGETWKEVQIDGVSGKVLKIDTDVKPDDKDDKNEVADAKKALDGAKQTYEQVREAIAKDSKDARIVSIELELRGGKAVYEVKALNGDKIAKMRVDAADGKVSK